MIVDFISCSFLDPFDNCPPSIVNSCIIKMFSHVRIDETNVSDSNMRSDHVEILTCPEIVELPRNRRGPGPLPEAVGYRRKGQLHHSAAQE